MKLLQLKNVPIFQQLQIEEALLRLSDDNYCIINHGSPPAIVMGISGKENELVDLDALNTTTIPLIRRFSGGGTVIVDDNTLFVSWIFRSNYHPFSPYPEPIMRWTEELYKTTLEIPDFHLRENDYAIGEKKVGGNAQYLRKNRWIHHTTFLWDFNPQLMGLLLHPKKTPNYRAGREHTEFLTTLKKHLPSADEFIQRVKQSLDVFGGYKLISREECEEILEQPHRKSTEIVSLHDRFAKH